MPDSAPARRRDLAPLRHLPRSVALNYLRQARAGPRTRTPALLRAIVCYARERLGPRHPFAGYPSGTGDRGVYALGGDDDPVRVSIAGDWASGTDEAAAVGAAIAASGPHFTIHLGDIYYVGDEREVGSSLLGERTSAYAPTEWPRGAIGSFALNGNHEMYARGSAYFERLLPRLGLLGGPPQRASFFCLENLHWRVVALDTAYNSVKWPMLEELPFWPFAAANELTAAQLRWLDELMRPGTDRRGLVILTHHAPYTRSGGCARFARQLARQIRQPVLWFFGHEHRLVVYDRHCCSPGLEVWGRNIGHGGMPVEPGPPADPPARVIFTDARRYPNEERLEVGYNGFASLTFTGPELGIDYYDLEGASVYRERWRAGDGELRPV